MAFKRQSGLLAKSRQRKAKKYEGPIRSPKKRYELNRFEDLNELAKTA